MANVGRPRKPPVTEVGTSSVPLVRNETQREELPRKRESSLGGPSLKLTVVNSNIEGYKLCWVNDDNGGLEQRYADGFDFVTPAEAGSNRAVRSLIVENKDVADRVSRHVGSRADGTAMKAYLMKCPNELWEEMEARRNAQADEWDQSINRGDRVAIEPGRSYVPEGYETKQSSVRLGVSAPNR